MSEPNDIMTTAPPADLPRHAGRFFAAAGDVHVIDHPAAAAPVAPTPSALQRLGAPPFPKSRFPFVGFLASVYDHVATHARGRGGAAVPSALPTPTDTNPAG